MVLLIRSTHRFQSTLPVRGATRQLARRPDLGGNFNPRSPCGERQMFSPAPCGASGYFNPRSPCGERRLYAESRLAEYKFQSTLPVRGATAASIFASNIPSISIHAPRAGSDSLAGFRLFLRPRYFNPRSPCGERQHGPARGSLPIKYFNPRSPCGERQHGPARGSLPIKYFNPRSPCGERR